MCWRATLCIKDSPFLQQEPADSDQTLTDEIEQPGVVPEHRHQDLYRPLALAAMHWLRSQGQHAIMGRQRPNDSSLSEDGIHLGTTLPCLSIRSPRILTRCGHEWPHGCVLSSRDAVLHCNGYVV